MFTRQYIVILGATYDFPASYIWSAGHEFDTAALAHGDRSSSHFEIWTYMQSPLHNFTKIHSVSYWIYHENIIVI